MGKKQDERGEFKSGLSYIFSGFKGTQKNATLVVRKIHYVKVDFSLWHLKKRAVP